MVTVNFPGGSEADRPVTNQMNIQNILNMPETEYIIEDMIPKNSIVFLVAREGSYKSFLLLDWSLHMAAGLSTWNDKKVRPGRVLYFAPEGASGMKKRIKAWQQHYNVNNISNFVLCKRANLFGSEGFGELINEVREFQPDVVIFDTLSRSMPGGDDSKTEHMNKVLNNAQTIIDMIEGTAIFAHHTKKGSDTYRGSTVIPGSADTMMFLDKKGTQVTLSCNKQKDDEEFDPMVFEPEPIGDSLILRPIHSMEFKMTPADVKIWKLLVEMRVSNAKLLVQGTGVSQAVVYRSLEKFLKYGKVTKEGTEYRVGN